ncbi:MAG TPA: heparan-alpha-glucosaminide N-acetyltransferase domain-containing protein [Gemmatimonadaceae bacterium]|nr:heparan-alpha-glucosaminide N-acetyltransferase domain-containing protein [Gemmatimonadaceae bacterium]
MQRQRVDSVDLLRGVIMVIMMLDHTRDFVHAQGQLFDPTDVSRTWPLLFFTRWITHYCAPIFVFLAGTGAYLQELRGKSKGELSKFLISRGLWLIVLELTVVRVMIFFNVDYPGSLGLLQVIWAIGWGMIVLAALIHLPVHVIVGLGVAMIALHNVLDGVHFTSWQGPGSPVPGFLASLWKVLHEPGVIFPFGYPGPPLLVLYPLIPWIGVMAVGYGFGALYRLDETRRRQILFRLGAAITLGFFVLRAINIYGDPSRWSVQSSPVMTALSFLAVSKYPPSLLFLMMTLGPAMLFLGWFDGRRRGALARIFIVYGRVPLFFYLLQWIVAHSLALLAGRIAGRPTDYLFTNIGFAPPPAPGSGFGLATVYALWILGVVMLYPLCRWYAGLKARRQDWWLSYL